MPNRIRNVQESATTGDDSSNNVGNKRIIPNGVQSLKNLPSPYGM